jgi:hypothetical protein
MYQDGEQGKVTWVSSPEMELEKYSGQYGYVWGAQMARSTWGINMCLSSQPLLSHELAGEE